MVSGRFLRGCYSTCWMFATRLNCAHCSSSKRALEKKVNDKFNSFHCALNISCGVLCRVKAETTCQSTPGTCSWSTWRYRSEFVSARTLSHRHVSWWRCGALHPRVCFPFLLWFSPRKLLADQVDRRVKNTCPASGCCGTW